MAQTIAVGDIVRVTWPESRHGIVIVEAYEGRVIKRRGETITVHFEYPAYVNDESSQIENAESIQIDDEDIEIDLSRSLDKTYDEIVSVERLKRHK